MGGLIKKEKNSKKFKFTENKVQIGDAKFFSRKVGNLLWSGVIYY